MKQSLIDTYDSYSAARASIGYGLDGGGYAFEQTRDALTQDPNGTNWTIDPVAKALGYTNGLVAWDDPDWDYFLGYPDGARDWDCPVLYLDIESHSTDWPDHYVDSEGDVRILVAQGTIYGSDHECDCYGVADGDEPQGWRFTGNVSDPAGQLGGVRARPRVRRMLQACRPHHGDRNRGHVPGMSRGAARAERVRGIPHGREGAAGVDRHGRIDLGLYRGSGRTDRQGDGRVVLVVVFPRLPA